jgi:electron transfer flavoprotein alpha subunit
MAFIRIHQDRITDREAAKALCPFGAITEDASGALEIGAGCRMCRICIRKGGGAFEFVDDSAPGVDKSKWRGVAVVAEVDNVGALHPVGLELVGKARELADKIGHPVLAVVIGARTGGAVEKLLACGADEVYVYEDPALEPFRIEPYANALEDFINAVHPSSVLVGGTVNGRSLAPRVAARFRTGLTADCTVLDMSESTDLDQIRPAYGGNIMAHINTPRHRPQFATVRYKIFSAPPKEKPHGRVVRRSLAADRLLSKIEVLAHPPKSNDDKLECTSIHH